MILAGITFVSFIFFICIAAVDSTVASGSDGGMGIFTDSDGMCDAFLGMKRSLGAFVIFGMLLCIFCIVIHVIIIANKGDILPDALKNGVKWVHSMIAGNGLLMGIIFIVFYSATFGGCVNIIVGGDDMALADISGVSIGSGCFLAFTVMILEIVATVLAPKEDPTPSSTSSASFQGGNNGAGGGGNDSNYQEMNHGGNI